MALSNEDKKDVSDHMGKALANKVSKVTRDDAMKKHYSNENQRKLHYDSIKKVVKKEYRGERYKKINEAFPVAAKSKALEKKGIGSVKEAVAYAKERASNTKKTGWEETGTGSRFVPKQFR
jgi:hypothetical protein